MCLYIAESCRRFGSHTSYGSRGYFTHLTHTHTHVHAVFDATVLRRAQQAIRTQNPLRGPRYDALVMLSVCGRENPPQRSSSRVRRASRRFPSRVVFTTKPCGEDTAPRIVPRSGILFLILNRWTSRLYEYIDNGDLIRPRKTDRWSYQLSIFSRGEDILF